MASLRPSIQAKNNLNTLAFAEKRRGNPRVALSLLLGTLREEESNPQPVTYVNISALLTELNRPDEAALYARQALDLLARRRSDSFQVSAADRAEDARLLATAYYNLAAAQESCSAVEERARARDSYATALHLAKEELGLADPLVGTVEEALQQLHDKLPLLPLVPPSSGHWASDFIPSVPTKQGMRDSPASVRRQKGPPPIESKLSGLEGQLPPLLAGQGWAATSSSSSSSGSVTPSPRPPAMRRIPFLVDLATGVKYAFRAKEGQAGRSDPELLTVHPEPPPQLSGPRRHPLAALQWALSRSRDTVKLLPWKGLGSSELLVNGKPVTAAAFLRPGDSVKVVCCEFKVQEEVLTVDSSLLPNGSSSPPSALAEYVKLRAPLCGCSTDLTLSMVANAASEELPSGALCRFCKARAEDAFDLHETEEGCLLAVWPLAVREHAWVQAVALPAISSGRAEWALKCLSDLSPAVQFGVISASVGQFFWGPASAFRLCSSGCSVVRNVDPMYSTARSCPMGTTVKVHLDLDASQISFTWNDTALGVAFSGLPSVPSGGSFQLCVRHLSAGEQICLRPFLG
eukprot:RCo046939